MLRITIGLSAILAASNASAATPTDNPKSSIMDLAVHSASEAFFNNQCHVGLSVGLADRGKTAFYNYGAASRKTKRLPTKQTVYEIASITKSFTGLLAARAVTNGKMTLDGNFRSYLNESYPNLQYQDTPITLRQLLTHTSGMPGNIPDISDLFQNPDPATLPFQIIAREKDYDDARYRKELHSIKVGLAGTESYSNIGVKLVSFALEDQYKENFATLVKTYITKPLALRSTYFTVPRRDRARLAVGYGENGKPMPYHLPHDGAAGGLYSTTQDMVKYLQYQLDESAPLVSTAHTALHGSADSYQEAYGLVLHSSKSGQRRIWQTGGLFGMSSAMVLWPDEQFGIILLANDGCRVSQDEMQEFADAVLKAREVTGQSAKLQ